MTKILINWFLFAAQAHGSWFIGCLDRFISPQILQVHCSKYQQCRGLYSQPPQTALHPQFHPHSLRCQAHQLHGGCLGQPECPPQSQLPRPKATSPSLGPSPVSLSGGICSALLCHPQLFSATGPFHFLLCVFLLGWFPDISCSPSLPQLSLHAPPSRWLAQAQPES